MISIESKIMDYVKNNKKVSMEKIHEEFNRKDVAKLLKDGYLIQDSMGYLNWSFLASLEITEGMK